jgi:hypothetical protein
MNRLWLAVIANVAVTAHMLYGWVIVHQMSPGAHMGLGFTWIFAVQVHLLGAIMLFPLKAKSVSSLVAWALSICLFAGITLWLILYKP